MEEQPFYKRTGLPVKEHCNLEDPEEMFLWMFVALPGVKGAPLLLPTEFWRSVSKHMYECGARLHEELQTKKFQPPENGDAHWVTGTGSWVSMDTPDRPTVTADDIIAAMPATAVAQLDEALQRRKNGEV